MIYHLNNEGPQNRDTSTKWKDIKIARSTCSGCGELFFSERAFGKHRTGSFADKTRRCMSRQEMLEKGIVQNDKGIWITALFEGGNSLWIKKEVER